MHVNKVLNLLYIHMCVCVCVCVCVYVCVHMDAHYMRRYILMDVHVSPAIQVLG